MRILLGRLFVTLLALGSGAANAGFFQVVNGGVGQFNENPQQPTVILWDSQGQFVVGSATYFWDSRLTLIGLSSTGGMTCSPSGNSINIVGPPFAGGTCQLTLRPTASVPVNQSQVTIGGGNCNQPCGGGQYQILVPLFTTNFTPPGNAFTLSGVVGGPAPTRVVRVTNTGLS